MLALRPTALLAAASFALALVLNLAGYGQHQEPHGSAANLAPPSHNPAGAATASSPTSAIPKASERLREDTRLTDLVGTFQAIGGDSVTFTPGPPGGNRDSFRVLENLALQRVGQVLDEPNKGTRLWMISGVVTEYRGANYLLLKKAVQLQEGETVK
jgi:hypothetical protein